MVLDCIDSRSLPPFFTFTIIGEYVYYMKTTVSGLSRLYYLLYGYKIYIREFRPLVYKYIPKLLQNIAKLALIQNTNSIPFQYTCYRHVFFVV